MLIVLSVVMVRNLVAMLKETFCAIRITNKSIAWTLRQWMVKHVCRCLRSVLRVLGYLLYSPINQIIKILRNIHTM